MSQPTAWPADVTAFLAGIDNAARRADCAALAELMESIVGEPPRLWSSSMVGFGSYHFRYASGREGDWFIVGFAPRKANLTIYLMSGLVGYADLLARLGPHTTGRACVYVKRLDGLDREVLGELISRSVRHLERTEADLGGVPRMSEMPPAEA